MAEDIFIISTDYVSQNGLLVPDQTGVAIGVAGRGITELIHSGEITGVDDIDLRPQDEVVIVSASRLMRAAQELAQLIRTGKISAAPSAPAVIVPPPRRART